VGGILSVSVEEVTLLPPITQNFERFLLYKQLEGKVMLSFAHTGGGSFIIHFGEIKEGNLAEASVARSVIVAPWQIYIFNPLYYTQVDTGGEFLAVRLVDEYAHYVKVDDPVELVDVSTLEVLGAGVVTALYTVKLRNMTQAAIEATFAPLASNLKDVINLLEYQYEQKVSPDNLVTGILIRATGPINLDTRQLEEDEEYGDHHLGGSNSLQRLLRNLGGS
jgi:hypothetical protein